MKGHSSKNKEHQRQRTFDINFAQLSAFTTQFNRFPEKRDNAGLYNWMAALRSEHKSRGLPQEVVERLNAIGFIWDKRDLKWHIKAKEVKDLLAEQKQPPTYNQHATLYYWLRSQLDLYSRGMLSSEKGGIIEEIRTLVEQVSKELSPESGKIGSVRELKWMQRFDELVEYRKQNPGSWPQAKTADEQEKKLGIWCQNIRNRYRKQILEDGLRDKLLAIGFNLEGRKDNWKERYNELKTYISTHQKFPPLGSNLYVWARFQQKRFNELSAEKQQLLALITFPQPPEEDTWEKRCAALREFILLHKKAPTRKSNAELNSWLTVQRAKYRNNKLTDAQCQALLDLGIDLNPVDTREDTWDSKYKALKKFRKEHPHRWPGPYSGEPEKQLYLWCHTQRQVYAGTAKNRQGLSKRRINKLNQIGFPWSLNGITGNEWEANFQRLNEFVSQHGSITIPARMNGKINPLYAWLRRQKKLIEENRLNVEKVSKLKALGMV